MIIFCYIWKANQQTKITKGKIKGTDGILKHTIIFPSKSNAWRTTYWFLVKKVEVVYFYQWKMAGHMERKKFGIQKWIGF